MKNSVDRVIKKISKLKVESFKDELLRQIDICSKEAQVIKITKNKLEIKGLDGHLDGHLNILIKKNEVSYEIVNGDISIIGKYMKSKNGYFVKISNKKLNYYDIGDSYSHDDKTKEIFKVFNKNGIEQFRRATVRLDNYDEDKETGMITIHKPDIMENYTENRYMWRLDGKYIVERKIRKYVYPDGTRAFIDLKNSDDCLLRYGLVDDNNKEIPENGGFYGFDKKLLLEYFGQKTTINDIIRDVDSKHYRKILNTNEISI